MVQCLAETDAGIEPDTVRVHAGGHGNIRAFGEEVANLADHIFILRLVLHGFRLAGHVHEDDRNAQLGRRFQRPRFLQGPHIIPDISASLDRSTSDSRLECIHRDARRGAFAQRLDDWDDPAQLFSFRHRISSGTCGFTTNIDHVSAIAQHFKTSLHGCRLVNKVPAIGETVRRDVENGHDKRNVGFSAGSEMRHDEALIPREGLADIRLPASL